MPGEIQTPCWIIGFDSSCSTCAKLSQELVRLSNGRLSCGSLRSRQFQQWRRQSLGADAPWTPTLFKVEGDRVSAWVGAQLAWRLLRLLEPRSAWLALQTMIPPGSGARRYC